MTKLHLHEKIRTSNRIVSYFLVAIFSSFFILPLGMVVVGAVAYSNGFLFAPFLILLLPVALVITIVEVMVPLSYKNFLYEITDGELRIEKGVITKTYKSIPFSRIQNVEIVRGILARFFGFSAVKIHTAGYSGPQNNAAEGVLPAVSVEEAERLRSILMKKSN